MRCALRSMTWQYWKLYLQLELGLLEPPCEAKKASAVINAMWGHLVINTQTVIYNHVVASFCHWMSPLDACPALLDIQGNERICMKLYQRRISSQGTIQYFFGMIQIKIRIMIRIQNFFLDLCLGPRNIPVFCEDDPYYNPDPAAEVSKTEGLVYKYVLFQFYVIVFVCKQVGTWLYLKCTSDCIISLHFDLQEK